MYRDEVRIRSLERRVEDLEVLVRDLEEQVAGSGVSLGSSRPVARPPEASPAIATLPEPPAGSARTVSFGPPPPLVESGPPGPAAAGPVSGTKPSAPPSVVPDSSSAGAWRDRTSPNAAPHGEAAALSTARTSPTSRRPSSRPSFRDLEEKFAGRALAWVGGLALIGAAVFFLSLAFSRGWINEPLRVAIGLIAGSVALGAGGWFLARRNLMMGDVLSAVGLGIISVALLAATRLYGLLPPEVGLLGALVAAIAAAAIAVRFDARIVAAFGLIAALLAPPLVGASPTVLTLAFVAVTLVGTTAVSLFRNWPWLPALAFLLSAPQLASWLAGDPDPAQALIALLGFWTINIIAAAGEEVRVRRNDLRPSSATLVLANATFMLWGGLVVLSGNLEAWRGTYIGLMSLAHLSIGGWFLRRQGMEHLFGNLVAATGLALLAIAAFVQLGAPVVPLAWAAEAVALAWLAVRRHHRWSALAAVVLGLLTVLYLLVVEYPFWQAGIPAEVSYAPPFRNPEAASLGAVLAAIAVSIAIVPVRTIRSALAGVAVLLAAYGVTFQVVGPSLAVALGIVAVLGLVADRLIEPLRVDPWLEAAITRLTTRFNWFASASGIVAAGMAIALLLTVEYPIGEALGTPAGLDRPATVSLAAVLVTFVAAGSLVAVRWVRSMLLALGVLLAAWAMLFDLDQLALVAILAVLLPVATVVDRALRSTREDARFAELVARVPALEYGTAAGGLSWLLAAGYAATWTMSPLRWGDVTPPSPPFSDERALVAALLAGSALAASVWMTRASLKRACLATAIVVGAWVTPFEVFADGVVVLWVALAGLAMALRRRDIGGLVPYTAIAVVLFGGATLVAFGIVAPPDRLVVVSADAGRSALLTGWPLAFVALSVALYAASRQAPFTRWRPWLELASGAVIVYAVSIGVVSLFQGAVGGSIATDELAVQAQVALSVCWAAIGAGALVVGLARRHPMLRYAGLGLVAIATVKVFLIDLASMDVAYRALVLAGIGVLLLVSAWLYTHFRGPRSGAADMAGGPTPAG